ncbi:Internalin-J precursor [compost metagenome]
MDLSKNENLNNLQVSFNKITSLDLSKNTKLTIIDCSSNSLTNLAIPTGNLLRTLDIAYNNINTLDVSTNNSLQTLEITKNPITSLDVSNNLNLTNLDCSQTLLKTVDVSKNTKLTSFICNYNSVLEQINLKNGNNTNLDVNNLYLTKNPSLYCITVDDVAYSNTNWSTKTDLYAPFTDATCAVSQYTSISDPGFEKTLIAMGIDFLEDGNVKKIRLFAIIANNFRCF